MAVAAFLAFVAVCWLWIVTMARDMYGPMSGASAWMMTAVWDIEHLLLLWAMWAVMMAGMMLPSAAPVFALYRTVARRRTGAATSAGLVALVTGYVAVWALFSVAVTVLQRLLASTFWLSPMMEPTDPRVGAGLLFVAGIYQVTPWKLTCLKGCASPLGFLMRHWRRGTGGAFRIRLEHGAHCVGCCWALMLLLFAGGVMNLVVIAALTAFVAFEKLAPFGVQGARVSGALLIGVGLWMLAG